MPMTRRQAVEERTLRTNEDGLASTSEAARTTAAEQIHKPKISEGVMSDVQSPHSVTGKKTPEKRTSSVRSQRSSASAIARIRQAEFVAEQQLAEFQLQEIQIQKRLVEKRLAAEVASIREEMDQESFCSKEIDNKRSVSDSLDNALIRGEPDPVEMDRPGSIRRKSIERCRLDAPNRATIETSNRSNSTTPSITNERRFDRGSNDREQAAGSTVAFGEPQELSSYGTESSLSSEAAKKGATELLVDDTVRGYRSHKDTESAYKVNKEYESNYLNGSNFDSEKEAILAIVDVKRKQESNNKSWFIALEFFYICENEWPRKTFSFPRITEAIITIIKKRSSWIEMKRFSSSKHLVRTIANVLAFVIKCQRRSFNSKLEYAKEAQNDCFPPQKREKIIERMRSKRGSKLRKIIVLPRRCRLRRSTPGGDCCGQLVHEEELGDVLLIRRCRLD